MTSAEKFAQSMAAHRLVAILRDVPDKRLEGLTLALAESGVKLIEVALSDPSAVHQVGLLRSYLPDSVQIGAGTVLSTELAEAAMDHGASFLVTPHVAVDVIAFAVQHHLGLLCGVMTPTEIMIARSHGAQFLKLFPAAVLGAEYIKQLRGPFPDLMLFPTGGISSRNLGEFLQAGASGAGIGGALTSENITEVKREAERLQRLLTR